MRVSLVLTGPDGTRSQPGGGLCPSGVVQALVLDRAISSHNHVGRGERSTVPGRRPGTQAAGGLPFRLVRCASNAMSRSTQHAGSSPAPRVAGPVRSAKARAPMPALRGGPSECVSTGPEKADADPGHEVRPAAVLGPLNGPGSSLTLILSARP